MIAVDTSSLVAYFQGESGRDVELVDAALLTKQAVLPPIVQTEILSDPKLKYDFREYMESFSILNLTPGYWLRAGGLRANILSKNLKARIADTLIAQVCIDHSVPLITRDKDFQHFSKYSDLVLER